jgi:inner membrane transporter RhtA
MVMDMKAPPSRVVVALAASVSAMISIQVGAAMAKQIFAELGSSGAAALRVGLAAILMAAVFRPWRLKVGRSEWPHVALFGLSLGAMNLTFYWALERIALGLAVAIEFVGPLAVAVFSSRRILDLLWVALAAFGLWLILPLDSSPNSGLDAVGIIFALFAGFFWALYIVFGHRVGKTTPAITATAWGMAVAALAVVPFGVPSLMRAPFAPLVLLIALGVAVFSSALPYLLEMIAMRRLPQQAFAVLMSLEPAIAALSGLVLLQEELSASQWSAVALVMTASLGSSLLSGNLNTK